MFKVILLSLFTFFASSALGQAKYVTVEVDPAHTVNVKGEIAVNSFKIAANIEKAADGSGAPIHLIINSGGGSVALGSQILSAVTLAKSRGHEIRCYVPNFAASMAFQVFIYCDKRYALKNALLLWHPMKSSIRGATAENLLYEGKRLQAWEKPFINDLLKALKIPYKTFQYHRQNETMWMAYEFKNLTPGFLTIVDDIKGATDLFGLIDPSDEL